MNKYQNGKIYKLVNTEGTLTYIGSTCQTLAKRKANHHSNYKNWKNGKSRYTTSFKIFDDDEDGCQIILLEAFPCESKIELEMRERYYIETIECINKVRPTRTIKEYFEDNKDKIQVNNKQYREKNREKLREIQKKYREDNKNKIQEYKNEKHKCICGGKYTTSGKSQHLKSMKHINNINSAKAQEDELEKLEKELNEI
jgi:hypothetical protein